MATTKDIARPETEFQNIAVEKIIDNTNNARTKFEDKEQNIPGLAADIKINGLIQPLVVFPRADGHYEIKAGSRRFRAVKLLAWRDVPCIIRKDVISDVDADLMSLAENEDRMNLSPFERAEAIRSFVEEHDMATKDIAKRIGKSQNYVNSLLRMSMNLAPSIKAEWQKGNPMATFDVLQKLARIEEPEKQVEAWKAVCGTNTPGTGDGAGEGEGGGATTPEKARSAKRAAEILLVAISEQDNPDVSAVQCLQYVLGKRKSAPEGLKLGKARKAGDAAKEGAKA